MPESNWSQYLGGSDIQSGVDTLKPAQMNQNMAGVLRAQKLSLQTWYQLLKTADADTATLPDNTGFIGGDIFTDSNGAKNTASGGHATSYQTAVDAFRGKIGTDEASGDTTNNPAAGAPNLYAFTNPNNAFDGNDSTYAEEALGGGSASIWSALGKTFSAKTIIWVRIKATCSVSVDVQTRQIDLETFDGASWNNVATLDTNGSYDGYYFLNATCQGIRVKLTTDSSNGASTHNKKVYTLEYSTTYADTTVTCDLWTLESAPDGLVVYLDADIPATSAITIDVSTDGGSTWEVLGATFTGKVALINTQACTGTNFFLRFNLDVTGSVTPTFRGFAVGVIA